MSSILIPEIASKSAQRSLTLLDLGHIVLIAPFQIDCAVSDVKVNKHLLTNFREHNTCYLTYAAIGLNSLDLTSHPYAKSKLSLARKNAISCDLKRNKSQVKQFLNYCVFPLMIFFQFSNLLFISTSVPIA